MSTATFFMRGFTMKELSIFIDESGDYGEYQHHSPCYIFIHLDLILYECSHVQWQCQYLPLSSNIIIAEFQGIVYMIFFRMF